MKKAEFKAISREVLSHIDAIAGTLKQHGVPALASITVDGNGYISFRIHDTGFDLSRLDAAGAVYVEGREKLNEKED